MVKSLSVTSVVFAFASVSRAFPQPEQATLKSTASPRYFGAALGQGHLENATDHLFAALAASEFSGATPENEMKWESTEPENGVFNFTGGDAIVSFAKQHNMRLRCHNLVWDSQLSPYVTTLPTNQVKQAMLSHIEGVVSHFKGDCYAWDVVNEPFNDDGTFKNDTFFNAMGKDYIEIALQKARSVDPHAHLYLNDFNTEGINNKSDAMFNLVKGLKKKNLIDGVGFESHFILNEIPSDLEQNLKRFAALGVDVAITELDIRFNTPGNETDLINQAAQYEEVVSACLAVSRCVGVTTWGITDLYSWIPGTFTGEGGALLWDDNYNKKPSFFSTIQTLLRKF